MGWAIALHGGAVGVALAESEHNQQAQEDALRCYLQIGVELLKSGKPALDVVELMVREMENNPDFNAGKGSVLNSEGKVSMDACIMDGNTRKCGAVSGLQTVVNPVSLARVVMDNSPHVFLAFDGAETFAREQGVETLDSSHFITPKNIKRLKREKEIASKRQLDFVPTNPKDVKNDKWTPNGDGRFGTVGCVAVDSNRNLAAATSTGGMPNKMVGRIGDTPIIGAGTYANNLCAVSVTGDGDVIISETLARNVAALMEYKGLSINDAAVHALESMPRNTAGLVAVSATGEVSMPFNTGGLLRACATEDGYSEIGIMA